MMEAEVDRLEDALGAGALQLENEFKLLLKYGYVTGSMDTVEKISKTFREHTGNPEFRRVAGGRRRLAEDFLSAAGVHVLWSSDGSRVSMVLARRNNKGHKRGE